MVTPAWVLQCLDQGATAVGLLPCRREDCRFGQEEVIEGRVNYCQALLQMMGGVPDSVRFLDPLDPTGLALALASLGASERARKANPPPTGVRFAPLATAQAVLGLAERYDGPRDIFLTHLHSPLGVVEIEGGCTACGACVSACPTGALALERDGEGISIVFDAPLCVGCKDCVPICPERVVRAEKVTDLRRLSQGKRVLYRVSEARCVKCGAPVAPRPMLDRIRSLLGDHPAFSAISRYCLECRKTLI
jgi:ferredoxin